MTGPRARRPWWQKKRWAAALALWLLAIYPLGRGPAAYAVARGWFPGPTADAVYGPLDGLLPRYIGPVRYAPENSLRIWQAPRLPTPR